MVLFCFFAIVLTFPNWANRKMVPASKAPISDEHEFYTEYYEPHNSLYAQRYKTRLPMKEYIVTHPRMIPLEFISGNGEYVQTKRTQEVHSYAIYAATDSVIRDNTLYFPGWKVSANNQNVPIHYTTAMKDSFGFITLTLPKGVYTLQVSFVDTPIRQTAKMISVVSVGAGILSMLYYFFLQRGVRKITVVKKKKGVKTFLHPE